MSIAAGTISLVSKSSTTISLAVTAASGGTGPYTNQWYRSTTSGFSPGGGNILTGKTALTLDDSGLIPGTTYYYKVVQTDTGHSNDTATAVQLGVTSDGPSQNISAFAQSPTVGSLDLRVGPANVISVQIDVSQATGLYAGAAVKMVDSADGIPKVVAVAADTDNVLGFIVYDVKSKLFVAGDRCEIAMAGCCMFLYATAAISRGAQVTVDVPNAGGVMPIASSDNVVGWAFDKATAYGQLIRVMLSTPSFAVGA